MCRSTLNVILVGNRGVEEQSVEEFTAQPGEVGILVSSLYP
jgi:hypothetical protein